MANLIRAAKSGSDWTQADLDTYNIHVHVEDTATFFGTPDLPQPHVDPEILNVVRAFDMTVDKNAELINLLEMAMCPTGPEDSAVEDFAVELFKTLGYVRRNRAARTRKNIPLLICGEQRHAKADVCIIDRLQSDILLVVQRDKGFWEEEEKGSDAEAQLIAEAIAAFDLKNCLRRDVALPQLDSKIMPGIVMVGAAPIFYKIPVTYELMNNVGNGTYPPQPTHVTICYPPVPRPNRRNSEGMEPLDNRREILRCYEAFKNIIGI